MRFEGIAIIFCESSVEDYLNIMVQPSGLKQSDLRDPWVCWPVCEETATSSFMQISMSVTFEVIALENGTNCVCIE